MSRALAVGIAVALFYGAFLLGRRAGRRGAIRWWEVPILLFFAAPFHPAGWLGLVGAWAVGHAWEDRHWTKKRHHQRKLSTQMARSLARGEIHMYYQAIVALETGVWVGAEALARWHCGDEVRTPGEWLGALLREDLAHEFTQSMLRDVCGVMRDNRHLRFSINMTPAMLCRPGWSECLLQSLWAMDVDPVQLCVEVTESMLVDDVATVRRELEAVRAAGVHVALDDFGSGTASVRRLIDFPISIVKIDRSLVQAEDRRYAETLVDLALRTGRGVVAEGVETEEQAAWLRGLGVQSAQGWLYARAEDEFQFGVKAYVNGRPAL